MPKKYIIIVNFLSELLINFKDNRSMRSKVIVKLEKKNLTDGRTNGRPNKERLERVFIKSILLNALNKIVGSFK